jgi:hypothetical protein
MVRNYHSKIAKVFKNTRKKTQHRDAIARERWLEVGASLIQLSMAEVHDGLPENVRAGRMA